VAAAVLPESMLVAVTGSMNGVNSTLGDREEVSREGPATKRSAVRTLPKVYRAPPRQGKGKEGELTQSSTPSL
jgi:hypothetical protein